MFEGILNANKLIILVAVIAYPNVVLTAYSATKETEIRSETVLHSSYDPISRPQSQTHIKAGLNILAIDELNLKEQKLTMAGWLSFEWEDDRLTWNKSAKDDIEYIFTKPGDVWKPELVVDNSLKDLDIIANSALSLRLKYDGTVEWEPLKLFEVHCQVDVTYYPYDRQKCAVEIVSWAYVYEEVVLDHLFSEVNLEDFERHGEWVIMDTKVEDKNLTEHFPNGVVRTYPQLDFWLFLRRRTEFYNLNVVMPIILTSLMVILVFIVPRDSGEKVSYVLTIFLSLAVLLTIVADSLPPTSITISVLGLYLGLVLVLAGLAILLTVLILILYHKEGHPAMDSAIMSLTSFAAKVTRMELSSGNRAPSTGDNRVEPIPPLSDTTSLATLDITSSKDVKIISDVNDRNKSRDNHVTSEDLVTWEEVATILDRFCFILFSLLTITMNISFVIALTVGGKTITFD